MLKVIGIGPGDKRLILPMAYEAMEEVDVILGSLRQKEILPSSCQEKWRQPRWKLEALKEDILALLQEGKKVGMLASGDPMLYGVGNTMQAMFGKNKEIKIEIIPGISSITYLFSRLGIEMNDAYLTSGHGRSLDIQQVCLHSKIGILTDKEHSPYWIAKSLIQLGAEYQMYIGENLSYPEESITKGSLEEIEDRGYAMNVVILVKES